MKGQSAKKTSKKRRGYATLSTRSLRNTRKRNPPKLPSGQTFDIPAWFSGGGTDCDVVTSSRIRLARNLADYPFPGVSSLEARKEVFELVATACDGCAPCSGFGALNLETIPKLSQELLLEERAISPELAQGRGDRGLVSRRDKSLGVLINEEDHLRLQGIGSGMCAEGLLEAVDGLDTALGRELRFAFDQRRGYLTSCPTNAGTGLRVSYLMHLPGLVITRTIDQMLLSASQMSMTARGFFGEHSDVVGAFFQISNQATMGASERDFLQSTEAFVRQTIDLERAARDRLVKDAGAELSDRIWRAYGILRSARLLSVAEFLNLSSALRLAIDCGLLKGMDTAALNNLTLAILPAHLRVLSNRELDERELAGFRAQLVRQAIQRTIEDA